MPITEHPYHIDEERSDIQFDVYGDQVAFMVPAGTGDTTIYDFYLIGDRDNTTPTNQNTFSALRILDEINSAIGYGNKYLRKDCEDETQYMLRLMGGAKVDGTLGLWIGDALLTYENGALHLSNCNGFWADGFISALGEGSGGGGGGGGGDFSREALFNVLKSSPNTGEYINPAFIPIDGTTLYIQNGTLKSRGTISSVGLAVPTGLTVSNSPLTANGTITIGLASGYTIPTSEQMSSFLTQATAAATYLSKADAATTYLTKTEAASTYLTKTEAASTYLRIDFFDSLFQAYNGSSKITPNTSLPSSTENINIKAMFGFWTEKYISSLGQGSSGGGGAVSYLDDILDVTISQPSNGQVLTYQNGMWVNGSGSVDAYTKAQSNALFSTIENTVTALGTNGNYLTWTKNGTTNNITVPYATKALQDASGNEITVTYLTKAEAASTYLRIDFFDSLFKAYNGSSKITPNTSLPSSTTNVNIKAMFGFWTEQYIASLGQSSGGGLYLNTLDDVDTEGAQDGQALVYDYSTGTWVPGSVSGGGLDPTAMWNALATSGNQQIDASHLSDALGSYLPLTGGTLTGGLTTRTITPASNSSYSLGSNASRWRSIYTTDVYSTYFSFHDGGYLQEERSELMWHEGNGSYTVIHSGNIDDYTTSITLSTTGSGNAFTSASLSNGTLTLTKGSTFLTTTGNAATATKASKVIDSYNTSKEITITYAKDGQSSTSWLASWNGYELGSISPSNITAGAAVKDGDGNTITSKYVTLDTPQIISESKTFSSTVKLSGAGIEDVGGAGLLMYRPSSGTWTGVSDTQWCVGSIDSQGVIRSNNNPLVHYKGSSAYYIIDSSGGTLVGELISTYGGYGSWIMGVSHSALTVNYTGNYCSILNAPTKNGRISLSTYNGDNDNVYLGYISDSHIISGSPNSLDHALIWNGANGNLTVDGAITPLSTKTYDIGTQSLCWRWVYAQWMGSPNGETFGIGANDQRHLHIATNGNIGIGMGSNTPSEKLHVSGNILATGDVTALSDIRHKSQISNVNTRIEDAADLPIFYFKWKAGHDDNMHIGTSAQAVQKLFPELVLGGEELSVNYGVLGTTLGILNSRKLTEHEKRILDLEKENKRLRREINKLKGVTK